MREILFRGKQVDNGEWYEGDLVHYEDDCPFIWLSEKIFPEFAMSVTYEVIPETVGQYTGLKDKNGRKIFEGDIIKARYVDDNRLTKGVVNFLLGCFCVKYNSDNNPAIDMLHKYEVIGNIYDNPELLKGGAE